MTVRSPASRLAHPRPARRLLAPLAVVAALALGACSSSSGGDQDVSAAAHMMDDSGSAQAERVAADADMVAEGEAAAPQQGSGDDGSVAVPISAQTGPLMVRTVRLEVLVDDILPAVSRARAAAISAEGWVSSEEVRPGTEDEPGWATIVLRVPSEDLDAVVTSLGELGAVTASRSDAQDVTSEYRDVEARIATLEAGADRLRELVADASGVEDIARLESELASREADLDSLKARMKVLAQDVSRSTITLHLAEDAETLEATVPDTGFLAGLRDGWEAFTTSVTVLLTAAGAVLPFLLVAALVGWPLLVWRRRRSRRSRPLESQE